MMIEFDEYKVKLNGLKPKLDELAASLGIERCKEDIERLHAQIESPGFWDNAEVSQKVMKQARQVEAKVERYEKMCSHWEDLMTICEMAIEENDDSMLEELKEGYLTVHVPESIHGDGKIVLDGRPMKPLPKMGYGESATWGVEGAYQIENEKERLNEAISRIGKWKLMIGLICMSAGTGLVLAERRRKEENIKKNMERNDKGKEE